ncbi:MAG: hemerythrin domain-containing protein [Candidatus Omnitrophica bacterium]|nr:hemerythrin domain-containing protein [Candidatus Omnitrophota bacterium]
MFQKKVVGFYTHDHDELDGYLNQYRTLKSQDFPKAREIFCVFRAGLLRHILWEEEILFPLFEAKTNIRKFGPTAIMRQEHGMIKGVLEDIHRKLLKKNSDSRGDEQVLIALLDMHNDKEEKMLYPAIDRLTSKREKEDLFKKMRRASKEGHEVFDVH